MFYDSPAELEAEAVEGEVGERIHRRHDLWWGDWRVSRASSTGFTRPNVCARGRSTGGMGAPESLVFTFHVGTTGRAKGILVYMWSERAAPWSCARRKPRPDRARSVSTLERNPVTGKRAAGSARATVRARARQTVLSRRKRRTRRKPEGAGSRKARRGCVPGFERVSQRERWIPGCP